MKSRIEKYLQEKKDSEYYQIKEGVFHSSECGLCPRLIYLSRTNPVEDSIETKKIYLVGNIFHKFIEKNLFKDYACEKKIEYNNKDFKIVGKVDAYNDKEAIDFKTCKDARYVYEPKKEYIVQMNIYLKILGLDKGRIIYIGKNLFDIKEFEIKYNEKLFRATETKIRFIHNKLKQKADPNEININPSPFCYYCRYSKEYCFKEQK